MDVCETSEANVRVTPSAGVKKLMSAQPTSSLSFAVLKRLDLCWFIFARGATPAQRTKFHVGAGLRAAEIAEGQKCMASMHNCLCKTHSAHLFKIKEAQPGTHRLWP